MSTHPHTAERIQRRELLIEDEEDEQDEGA
jgi:hypothetical protein